jgi:nucleotide-binding universal stress UspA family protein
MFTNVLVGLDGRSGGRDATALAQQLASRDGRMTLVHVHPGRMHPLNVVTPGLIGEEQRASKELLDAERTATGAEAALVSVEAGSPGAGLHREAEDSGADLLVVGSTRRGPLGRVMLGDDTRAALNGAPCAVAVAASGYAEAPLPIAKIGVAYNGSPEARAALRAATELAAGNRAQVLALEVVSIPTYAFTGLVPPAYGETVDLMLSEASDRMKALDGVSGRAVYGLAGEELAVFAGEVDLLVVGSRSYGPIRRLIAGSTTDYLQRHARCSLLVLPRGVGTEQEGETAQAAAASG